MMTNIMDRSSSYCEDPGQAEITIENILSIWPTLQSLAESSSAGDLISLSRTSRSTRSTIHAFEHSSPPALNLGHHETPQWALLKSVAPFTCISPTHKDPKSISSSPDHSRKSQYPIRPCNFCSRPICRTCIVRSFFADPTQSRNTFKHRTRHLCTSCWDTGNLRKDYRYPLHASTSSREHIWVGRNYALRGQRCTCSASEDNWLCHPCRNIQNESGPLNMSFFDVGSREADKGKKRDTFGTEADGPQSSRAGEVPCYGLNCTKTISLTDASRDRRRICLWCSRPLARPFGGEDRLRWEEKQLNIRAAHAASRSADIAAWARNRFRSLTMSRREMRGSETCDTFFGADEDHDQPIFVKHLDAVNYRALVGEAGSPTPEDVYKSKHGQWRYNRAFLLHRSFWRRHKGRQVDKDWINGGSQVEPPSSTSPAALFALTSTGALPHARRNSDFPSRIAYHGGPIDPTDEPAENAVVRLAVQFLAAGIMTELELTNLMASRYITKKIRHWDEILDKLYDELMIYETRFEGDMASRDVTTTFDAITREKGVLLKSERAPEKRVRNHAISNDSQPGPSETPHKDVEEVTVGAQDSSGSGKSEDKLEEEQDELEEGEENHHPWDQPWEPPVPPGSPPPFVAAETGRWPAWI